MADEPVRRVVPPMVAIRPEMRMRCAMLAVAAVGAGLLAWVAPAQAQSGSTGGTIGKQGRSASGSEAAQPDVSAPARSPSGPAVAKQGGSSGSSCAKVVGVWKGPLDFSTFKANGTVTSPSFPTEGPWTCRNGQLVIKWKDWGIDRCSLSSDGSQMTCTNDALGNSFSRVRTSGN